MMKKLPSGICVLEGDGHLSRWIEESGSLINKGDVAMNRNLELIQSGMAVVDGGAALGGHTRAYLDKVGKGGVVYAFEPNPDYYHCLVMNCPDSIYYDRALWHENTNLLMDLPKDNNIGSKCIDPINGITPVEAIALDYLALDRCDFIKLDIEGSELMALRGAKDTIDRFRPIIQCELNPPVIEKMGYKVSDLNDWFRNMNYTVSTFGVPSLYGACELLAMPA